jgi:hypothetical protein
VENRNNQHVCLTEFSGKDSFHPPKENFFPGEDEMLALASGVLRVLRGEKQAARY